MNLLWTESHVSAPALTVTLADVWKKKDIACNSTDSHMYSKEIETYSHTVS